MTRWGRGATDRSDARGALLAATVAAAIAAGCAHAPPTPAPEPFAGAVPQNASAEEVRARIDAASAEVTSVRGKLSVGLRETARARYRSCRGALAARSPWSAASPPGIHLRGYRNPAPTFFTLVSDGREFWLHVPSDQVVYTGPVARHRPADGGTGPALDARDLFRGLFLAPVGGGEVEVEAEAERYVVSVRHEGRLVRRIWVDRRGLVVRREVFLDAAGAEELVVEREQYRDVGGHLYPARIVLTDPVRGAMVRLEFESLVVDPPDLSAEAFRPPAPRGARIERLAGEGEKT